MRNPIFETVSFLNESKEIIPEKIFGFYDDKGIYNSVAVINGKNYRNRVECLIFRNNKVYLSKDKYDQYIIPGGSAENGILDIDQVANECKEEARISIKNTRYTGISYITKYKNGIPSYVKTLPHQWIGWYSKVFVADFDEKFKGYVREYDRDDRFLKGKFYDISTVISDLKPEWKEAIKIYLKK